jgi:hypothetical protein
MVNRVPVQNHSIRKPIARIGFDLEYELQMARIAIGISIEEFQNMAGTQIWCPNGELCKSELLVLYRLQNRTEAVTNEIHTQYLDRQRKGKRYGK